MTFTVAKDDLNMGEARIVTRVSLAPVMTDAEDLQGSLLLVTAAFEGLYEFMKDGAENGVDMETVRVDVHGLPETHGRGFCAVAAHMGTLGMRCEESGWLDPDVFREAVAACREVLTPDFYKALNR